MAADQQPAADPLKDSQKKADEFAEAAQAINGPAGNPECVWLGRRVVVLMWRDDLDTAFRHLDLYDRFGCPTGALLSFVRSRGPTDRFSARDAAALGFVLAAAALNLGYVPVLVWMKGVP